MLAEEKSCWMKVWLEANFSYNTFWLIQNNFHVGSVYFLFHTKFHFYNVISNVRISNFEWFNKTKTLCKIITIKKIMHFKSKWVWTAATKILATYLNCKNKMGKNKKMQQKKLKIAKKANRSKKVYKGNRKKRKVEGNVSTFAFYLGVYFHH